MNLLQQMLFVLFWKVLDPYPENDAARFMEGGRYLPVDQAMAVWNVISSDATQREMMLAAAKGFWIASPRNRMLSRIRWLKSKADLLGAIRNDAAHLVVDLDRSLEKPRGRLVPAEFGNRTDRLKRLREVKNIEDHFRHVVGDINQLYGYARGIAVSIANPHEPLPRKPKLRSVPN